MSLRQYMEFKLSERPFKFWWPEGTLNHNPLDICEAITAENVEAYILAQCAARSSSIVECGTQYGLFSTIMACSLPLNGKLIGLEILPLNAQTSNENLKTNGLGNKALVLHAAIAETDGYDATVIDIHKENASVVSTCGPIHGIGTMEVPCFSLGRLQSFFGRFDMLKMDIEGFEGNVLQSAGASLADVAIAAVEIHPHLMHRLFGRSVDVIRQCFPEDEFASFVLVGQDGRITVHAWDEQAIIGAPTANAFFFKRSVHGAFAAMLRKTIEEGLGKPGLH